jgi:hypothetical protein
VEEMKKDWRRQDREAKKRAQKQVSQPFDHDVLFERFDLPDSVEAPNNGDNFFTIDTQGWRS